MKKQTCRPKSFISFIIILFFASSITVSAKAKGGLHKKMQKLRRDAEILVRRQSEMYYKTWVYGAPSNQAALYKKYGHIFTKDSLKTANALHETEKNINEKKALLFFKLYLLSEFISKQQAKLFDEVENIESEAKVTVGSETIPYRELRSKLYTEKDAEKRKALYMAADPVLDTLNVKYLETEKLNQSEAKKLGYVSYVKMCEDLKFISFEKFKLLSQNYLKQTGELYANLLEERVQNELGVPLSQFYRYDILRLFKAEGFDKYFPEKHMISLLTQSLQNMGIYLNKQRNLKIDMEKRPKKNPRAVCFPVRVPGDVRLSIKPVGGLEDYISVFHEMGHGQHFANTKEKKFEFQQLGTNAVTESYAFLLEYLLSDPYFMKHYFKLTPEETKAYFKFRAFERVYIVRRYAAKFLYELVLHSGDTHQPPEKMYSLYLSDALKYAPLPSDEKRYLDDVDANFYVVDYVQAWFLEAMLKQRLRGKFGNEWFMKKESGKYLRSLWAHGQKLTGKELAQKLGFSDVTPDALVKEIELMLKYAE